MTKERQRQESKAFARPLQKRKGGRLKVQAWKRSLRHQEALDGRQRSVTFIADHPFYLRNCTTLNDHEPYPSNNDVQLNGDGKGKRSRGGMRRWAKRGEVYRIVKRKRLEENPKHSAHWKASSKRRLSALAFSGCALFYFAAFFRTYLEHLVLYSKYRCFVRSFFSRLFSFSSSMLMGFLVGRCPCNCVLASGVFLVGAGFLWNFILSLTFLFVIALLQSCSALSSSSCLFQLEDNSWL